MTFAHLLMDVSLWVVAFIWFCGFLARGPKYRQRNRRLDKPSEHCNRVGSW